MRKLFFLIILLAFGSQSFAQNWIQYDRSGCNIRFELPTDAYIIDVDSLHTAMYSSEVDSLLALQVHVFDSAYLDANEEFLAVALLENNGDTLRAIAQLFLFATNSELLSLEDVTNDLNEVGLEIGMDYMTLESDIPALNFVRYFHVRGYFIAFSITGSEDDVPRLMDYKDQFFNSIIFY